MNQLAKYSDQAYALLRIVAGLMFSFHGAQKILGILSDFQPAAGSGGAWTERHNRGFNGFRVTERAHFHGANFS